MPETFVQCVLAAFVSYLTPLETAIPPSLCLCIHHGVFILFGVLGYVA